MKSSKKRASCPVSVEKSIKPEAQHVLALMRPHLTELNLLLRQPPSAGSRGLSSVFNGWCSKVAGSSYPNIGSVAHAVPRFFFSDNLVTPYPKQASSSSGLDPQGAAGGADAAQADDGRPSSSKDRPKNVDLTTARRVFVVNNAQESALRGDTPHRVLGRAFRILNTLLEKEKKKTMFIMSQLHYDHLLGWLRRAPKMKKTYPCLGEFDKIFDNPPSYINIKEINEVCEKRGGPDLMILHEEKGIIFVQIKSIGTHTAAVEDFEKKLKETDDQLTRDVEILRTVMKHSADWENQTKIKQVIAVPNLSKREFDNLGLSGLVRRDIIILYREDMMKDCIEVSECESDIKYFKNWWQSLEPQVLTKDCMEEIIGKYVGPLSAVIETPTHSQKKLLLQFKDCVKYASLLAARKLLAPKQIRVLETDTKNQTRVYISGPPGSGKTVLLMFKGHTFLKQSPDNHVIVVNMYRGAEGRAVGQYTYDALVSTEGFRRRVHLLQIDVGTAQNFVEKVNEILAKAGVKREGCQGGLDKVLFLVDEIYVESFWAEILSAFRREFTNSLVWCAGLFSSKPEGFDEHEMNFVLRCPPAVQNLLYHVDWSENRKGKYRRDTEWLEVSTNGPIPLCVRHETHVHDGATPGSNLVIRCEQCGKELAAILKGEVFGQIPREKKAASAPPSSTSGQGSTEPEADLGVVILVNLPRDSYAKVGPYIHTGVEQHNDYMSKIKSTPFFHTLIQEGIKVEVKVQVGCKEMVEGDDTAMATWLYNFQGLEAGVVIFLPGDPFTGGTSAGVAKEREIPAPGLNPGSVLPSPSENPCEGARQGDPTLPSRASKEDELTAGSHGASLDAAGGRTVSGREGDGPDDPPVQLRERSHGGGEKNYSLSLCQWTKADIDRFSDWDKTNIMVAGSRSLSLLILLVP